MRMVSASPKKLHIIASKTTGTAEKNIIQQDNGILDLHKNAQYYGNGDKDNKLPHIKFEDKIIYILGYDNKDKWRNVLGSQFGCVYIDEINTADIDFVREISTRNDYLMATLNPDDPSLPVYKEFVNRSRPYKKYIQDVPPEIMSELTEEPVPNWKYWFFSFADNLSLTPEVIEKKKTAAPRGTKLYKNKILGLRGKATGLVFSNFDRQQHIKSKEWAKQFLTNNRQSEKFMQYSAGLDTAYSQKSPDTIAMSFIGITDKGICVVLDERVYNNADLKTPIAPSDTVKNFVDFLERNRQEWGLARNVFIDSADQATITELNKYEMQKGCIYTFNSAWKKTQIIDRINLQLGWLAQGLYHPRCKDVHTTYFEGITTSEESYSKKELDEQKEKYTTEEKQAYCKRQESRYSRMSKYSLDADNRRMYAARAKEWRERAEEYGKFNTDSPYVSERSKSAAANIKSVVDTKMLNSSNYRRMFDRLGENEKITRSIFQQSKAMLNHRSGSNFEDLCFIDSKTGKFLTRTDYNVEKQCVPSNAMKKMVGKAEERTIISIHNHPNSTVPSLGDINAAWNKKYKYGIIVCHNGNLYKYKIYGEYDKTSVDMVLDRINSIIYNRDILSNQFNLKLARALSELRENNISLEVFLWK